VRVIGNLIVKKERTLKVYCRADGKSSNFPEIRISGVWLHEIGFEIGDYIRIAYDVDMIVIKKIECENNSE